MKTIPVSVFFYRVTQLVCTPLLAVALVLLGDVATLAPSDALSTYHSYPAAIEHLLAGVLFYLIFALLLTKWHLAAQSASR